MIILQAGYIIIYNLNRKLLITNIFEVSNLYICRIKEFFLIQKKKLYEINTIKWQKENIKCSNSIQFIII